MLLLLLLPPLLLLLLFLLIFLLLLIVLLLLRLFRLLLLLFLLLLFAASPPANPSFLFLFFRAVCNIFGIQFQATGASSVRFAHALWRRAPPARNEPGGRCSAPPA